MDTNSVPEAPAGEHEKIVRAALSRDPAMITFTRDPKEDFRQIILDAFPEMDPGQQNDLWKDPYWREWIKGNRANYDQETRHVIDSLQLSSHLQDPFDYEKSALLVLAHAAATVRDWLRTFFRGDGSTQ